MVLIMIKMNEQHYLNNIDCGQWGEDIEDDSLIDDADDFADNNIINVVKILHCNDNYNVVNVLDHINSFDCS